MGAWPFDFGGEVAEILGSIPAGKVVTITGVAEALGDALARRAVEEYLRQAPLTLPLHRVVDNAGRPLRPGPPAEGPGEGWAFQRGGPTPRGILRQPAPLQRLRGEQEAVARRAVLRDDFDENRGVAGADVAYEGARATGAVVVVDPTGAVRATSTAGTAVEFPYIPTYLAYREFPALAAALEPVRSSLGLLMVEGHGALHPRRAGLATFVGVTLDLPTVGVARRPLGFPPGEPLAPGDSRPIELGGRVLGYALGLARRRRPIYISPGHRISPESAARIAAAHCEDYMPEPLRLADSLARKRKGERGLG